MSMANIFEKDNIKESIRKRNMMGERGRDSRKGV